ncbi:MAG: thiazole synthase [Candidatus Berkiella sp.]
MWLGDQYPSRLLLGTAQYPSIDCLAKAIVASNAEIMTVSLKHENVYQSHGQSFWQRIKALNRNILPNTAGCVNADEAIELAEMAREVFQTNWIKLEVICPRWQLQPNPLELIKAAKVLVERGFKVFPFSTDDVALAVELYDSGCQIIMPWGAPIGSGKGLLNVSQLHAMRKALPKAILIIDAGIGSPVHALQAMQLGFDGVLVNSAIAKALDPVMMAKAFALAVESGRLSYEAGVMVGCDFAQSTVLSETLFGEHYV